MNTESANVDFGGKGFLTGRWASERLLECIEAGVPISPAALRTLSVLRRDEWIHYDEALIEEARVRLRAVGYLIEAGLVIPITNAMGKTLFEWESVSDLEEAGISLDGISRTDNERLNFDIESTPLPIVHKDWNIKLRTLAASRERGEALDTLQARMAGRKVSERIEKMMFLGGPTFRGHKINGLTTHPNRNTLSFGTNGSWSQSAKTGGNILSDLLAAKAILQSKGFYGPYWVLNGSASDTKLDEDYATTAAQPLTIRERLRKVGGVQRVETIDSMPADDVVIFQATRDVIALLNGEEPQNVQWDLYGGFMIAFKAFAIQVPLIRSTQEGNSGVVHLS